MPNSDFSVLLPPAKKKDIVDMIGRSLFTLVQLNCSKTVRVHSIGNNNSLIIEYCGALANAMAGTSLVKSDFS
jgi:hypothetical protein